MRNLLSEILAEILSPNREQSAIPPMDGAWTPNSRLERAPRLAEDLDDPQDLCIGPERDLFVADGSTIYRFFGPGWASKEVVARAEATVLGLTWHARTGLVACIDGFGVKIVDGPGKGATYAEADGVPLSAPRAALVTPDEHLLVADSSLETKGSDWLLDFMAKGNSGRIVMFDLESGEARQVCSGLAYPTSLMLSAGGDRLYFTEAWGARISCVSPRPGSRKFTVLRNLPAYPWRVTRGDGCVLASFMSTRTQLVEFLLKDEDFREEMMRNVPRDYWIAPAFRPPSHIYEPIQGGQLLQHGKAKAWAPSRSYGLVAEFQPDFELSRSFHSRFGEQAHGIVAVAELGAHRLALSAGAGAILDLGAARP